MNFFAAPIFWAVWMIDDLLMWLLPKYKAKRFFDDLHRLRSPHDHKYNAIMIDSLSQEYGYKREL